MEKSEKFIILSDDFALNFPAKSFHCTFCKRGFSNAQALGGHMNIHRKDRVKLREFSDENLLSLEISRKTNWEDSHPPNSSPREKLSWENDRSSDSDPAESLNCIRGKPPRRLPLFAEVPPRLSGGEVSGDVLGKHADSREERLKYGELDLELRLGPEHNDNQGSSEFKVNVLQGTRARELKKG